jgi:hypothetical protein
VRYHRATGVYACRADEGIVFLDARRDRYFGVGGKDVVQLTRVVAELHNACPDDTEAHEPLTARIVDKLLREDLLRPGDVESDQPRRESVPALEIDSAHKLATQRCSIRVSDLANFAWACARTSWSLRRWSIGVIATRITAERSVENDFDFDRTLALVEVFRRLRRWVFSEKNRCLFNALALIYFLQRYRQFPYFVIGVKTAPFAAHAWVQRDRMLLDGNPANVGHFTPILVA